MDKAQITRHHFQHVLRRYRLAADLSQEQMSGYVGVSRGFYSLLELGKRWPNVDMLIRIAKAINVRPGEMIDALIEEAEKEYG